MRWRVDEVNSNKICQKVSDTGSFSLRFFSIFQANKWVRAEENIPRDSRRSLLTSEMWKSRWNCVKLVFLGIFLCWHFTPSEVSEFSSNFLSIFLPKSLWTLIQGRGKLGWNPIGGHWSISVGFLVMESCFQGKTTCCDWVTPSTNIPEDSSEIPWVQLTSWLALLWLLVKFLNNLWENFRINWIYVENRWFSQLLEEFLRILGKILFPKVVEFVPKSPQFPLLSLLTCFSETLIGLLKVDKSFWHW